MGGGTTPLTPDREAMTNGETLEVLTLSTSTAQSGQEHYLSITSNLSSQEFRTCQNISQVFTFLLTNKLPLASSSS